MIQYLSFELWSTAFWIISSFFFVAIIGLICEKESFNTMNEKIGKDARLMGATVTTAIFLSILAVFSSFNVFMEIYHNPLDCLTSAI